MHRLTRRQTTALMIAAGVCPGLAFAQNKKKKKKGKRRKSSELSPPAHPELAELLAALLNDRLNPDCAGKFSVPAFDIATVQDGLEMKAVVRMDWPPGWRRRRLAGVGGSEEAAFRSLFDACIQTFGEAWPGCMT